MADTLNVYRDQGDLTPPHGGGGGKVLLTIVALCLVLGGIAWFLLRDADHPAPPPPPPDAGTPAPPKPTLPSPSESDPRVRSLLEGASADPLWAGYLKQSDLVRVFVSATQNISEGESPRTRLFFLQPEGKFEVTEKTDRRRKTKTITASPKSYARYDAVATVVDSLDPQVLATAYVSLKPWIELAYEEIGPRNTTFDSVWTGAVNRLVNAPMVPANAQLVEKGLVFAYADPALEGLSAAEKHLLRMGPKNQKVIQDKLKAISEAIAAAPAATDGGTMDADGGSMMATGDAGEMSAATMTTDGGASDEAPMMGSADAGGTTTGGAVGSTGTADAGSAQ